MTTEQLDRTFAALADPTRRTILARLASGDATVSELAKPLPISIQAVSKHLKVLEGAGLITRGRTAQLRPSHLEGAPLKQLADWIEGYRSFWESGFGRMEKRLQGGARRGEHG
jgi:DNA-binding transcriptional ArsR family regulator